MCDDLGIPEMMNLWEVKLNGSKIICESIKSVLAIVEYDTEDFQEGDTVVIKRISMTDKKYKKLPEFEGY
jgi:hypothetical protein